MSSDAHNVPVVFTTQTPYVLPPQKFMIPASWRRYQLSQLVNKALSLDHPIPFDFIVRGDVVRASLADWCNEKGVGTEETLEIEYVESLMPPQHIADFPHDTWVAGVSCQIPGYFVTGSYDAHIRIFDSSRNLTHTIPTHDGPITSLCIAPSPENESDSRIIASASHDGTVRLTSITISEEAMSSKTCGLSKQLASLHLHTAPLTSVSTSSLGSHLLTASRDHMIGLWDTRIPDEDQVPSATDERERKRRKKAGEGNALTDTPKRKAPLAVLKSHTGAVTRAIFESGDAVKNGYSCGLDSTVRAWDVEAGVCTGTMNASEKPFIDITLPSLSNSLANVVIASSMDRSLTVYDTRTLSKSPAVGILTQPSTPSCLASSPVNAYHFASGGYDGIVRIWDLRSLRAVGANVESNGTHSVAVASFKVPEKEGKNGDRKILALDWVKGLVGVGGESGLDVWKVPE